jgi:hypothetical protein
MTSGGRRRARTSCWVIVDAPRSSGVSPLAFWKTAAAMAAGSKPSLVQKVRSSAVVVASMTRRGTSS